MKVVAGAFTAAGLVLIGVLVYLQGPAEVGAAFAELGAGVLLMVPVYLLHLSLGAAGWGLLFVPPVAPRHGPLLAGVWVGSSLNTVLPTGTVGGEAAKARVLVHYDVPGADGAASVIVDTTTQSLSLALWSFIGVACLASLQVDPGLVTGALAATGAFVVLVAVFTALQMRGSVAWLARAMRRLSGSRPLQSLAGGADAVDARLRAIYRRPGRVALSTLVRLAGRMVLTGEVWLAAALMGAPIGLFEALVLKSLSGAARGIAFFVPNGLGVQELVFVIAGGALGVAPEVALAVSLATRARELLVSVPALWWWQRLEGRRLAG